MKKPPVIANKKLSVSIGVGEWRQNEGWNQFFSKVDKAVYKVKESKKIENKIKPVGFVVVND